VEKRSAVGTDHETLRRMSPPRGGGGHDQNRKGTSLSGSSTHKTAVTSPTSSEEFRLHSSAAPIRDASYPPPSARIGARMPRRAQSRSSDAQASLDLA
jgi:hypothetical protein